MLPGDSDAAGPGPQWTGRGLLKAAGHLQMREDLEKPPANRPRNFSRKKGTNWDSREAGATEGRLPCSPPRRMQGGSLAKGQV